MDAYLESILEERFNDPNAKWNWDIIKNKYAFIPLHVCRIHAKRILNIRDAILEEQLYHPDFDLDLFMQTHTSSEISGHHWFIITEEKPLSYILKHPDYDWSHHSLARREDITWDIIFSCGEPLFSKIWGDGSILSSRPDAIKVAMKYPHLKWYKHTFINKHINGHTDITLETIKVLDLDNLHGFNNIYQKQIWINISNSKGISFQDIYETKTKYPWNLSIVSSREDLTFEIFQNYKNKLDFDYSCLSVRFDFMDMYNHKHLYKWDWKIICQRNDIPLPIMLKYKDVSWNWNVMELASPDNWTALSEEEINNLFYNDDIPLSHVLICKHLPLHILRNYPPVSWVFDDILSYRSDLTEEFVEEFIDFPWCWKHVFKSKHISSATILKWINNPEYKEYISLGEDEWYSLMKKKDIDWYVIINNYYNTEESVYWNWYIISKKAPWDIIIANQTMPLEPFVLSKRKDISWTIIKSMPDFNWYWAELSRNIAVLQLSDTEVYEAKLNYYTQLVQKKWLNMYYNPSHRICRNRLLRECEDLNRLIAK